MWFLCSGPLVPGAKDILVDCQLIFKTRVVSDGDDSESEIGQLAALSLVAISPVALVVVRPIAERAYPWQPFALVVKIGFCIDMLRWAILRPIRQSAARVVQEFQEVTFHDEFWSRRDEWGFID